MRVAKTWRQSLALELYGDMQPSKALAQEKRVKGCVRSIPTPGGPAGGSRFDRCT